MFQDTLDFSGEKPHYGALVLRIGLGLTMIAHAMLKLFVLGLPKTSAFFAAHGFPGWMVIPISTTEIIGGVLLILGITVRWVSIILIPVIVGAMAAHWPNGFWAENPHGGWEPTGFLLIALVAQALMGGGRICVWPGAARTIE
jgi:putative oxidoreductase